MLRVHSSRAATKIIEVFLAEGAPKRVSSIPADSEERNRVIALGPQAAKSFVILVQIADIIDSLGFKVLHELFSLALESFLVEFPKFVQDLRLLPTHATSPRVIRAGQLASIAQGVSTPGSEFKQTPIHPLNVNSPVNAPRQYSSLLLSTKDKSPPSDQQSPTDGGPSSLPALSFNTSHPSLCQQPLPMCASLSNMPALALTDNASSSSGGSTPSSPKRSKSSSTGGTKGPVSVLPGSPGVTRFEEDGMNWLIDESELKVGGVVGVGQSALIHEATWRGQRVAVKFMKQKADKKTMENFQRECQLLMSVRTPQIVFFYGAVIIDSSLCLILEYCARGSLEDYMKEHASEFTWERFFTFARQATEGLLSLHKWKPAIVHRDFKGQNLLVCFIY